MTARLSTQDDENRFPSDGGDFQGGDDHFLILKIWSFNPGLIFIPSKDIVR
jgi:hypothetical protein